MVNKAKTTEGGRGSRSGSAVSTNANGQKHHSADAARDRIWNFQLMEIQFQLILPATFWTFWPASPPALRHTFMYPRARLDALTDGIFAVAMTLLVLDLRLAESFHPRNADELLRGLYDLVPNFIPYVLSFLVLGLRWLSSIQPRTKTDGYDRSYFKWWLVYLLLITCVPFTTTVAGRFAGLAPAIWLYAGNTVLIGLVSFALLRHTPQIEKDEFLRGRQVSLAFLIGSSLLAIAWSFVNPREALLALALNVLAPVAGRWIEVNVKG